MSQWPQPYPPRPPMISPGQPAIVSKTRTGALRKERLSAAFHHVLFVRGMSTTEVRPRYGRVTWGEHYRRAERTLYPTSQIEDKEENNISLYCFTTSAGFAIMPMDLWAFVGEDVASSPR